MTTPYRILIGSEDVTEHVDDGWSFTNGDPGGHLTADLSFPRLVSARRGERVRYEIGLQAAWEGRVAEVGPALAGSPQTQIGCEGLGVLLQEPVAEIYIDHQLSGWEGTPVSRHAYHVAGGRSLGGPEISPDGITPGLALRARGAWAVTALPLIEGWYDAGDLCGIAEIGYAWQRNANINPADVSWDWEVLLGESEDLGSITEGTGNLRSAGPASGTLATTGEPRRYARVVLYYGSSGGVDNAVYEILFTRLPVYGSHGLTKRGAETLTQPQGFWPQDIAVHAMLKTGANFDTSLVEESAATVVRQAAYRKPVPGEDIIAEQAKIAGGWHYGTWAAPMLGGQPRLAFRSLPTQPTAVVARGDCDALNPVSGLSGLYDRALVSYQDAVVGEGVVEVLRPNAELAKTAAGSRTMLADAGTASKADARTYGLFQLAIAEMKAKAAGNVSLTQNVTLPGGGSKPAGLLMPGLDMLRITDIPDMPLLEGQADYQLKQVKVTGGREGISADVQLGTGADYAEVLQARLDAATEQALNGR